MDGTADLVGEAHWEAAEKGEGAKEAETLAGEWKEVLGAEAFAETATWAARMAASAEERPAAEGWAAVEMGDR